jgi:hypothetical protein
MMETVLYLMGAFVALVVLTAVFVNIVLPVTRSQKQLPTVRQVIDNLDIILAALGGALAIPLTLNPRTVIGIPIFTVVGVIAFLVSLVYLLSSRRALSSTGAQAEATPCVYLLLNILFFGLLTCSIAAFHLRPELYTRPLGYFVALAAMVAIVAIEILFLPRRKSAPYFSLLKIMLISLSMVWSQLLLYPIVSIGLSALFMAVLLLTHTITTVTLIMVLFLIWLTFELYRKLRYGAVSEARIFVVAAILSTGAVLGYWALVSGHTPKLTAMARGSADALLRVLGLLPPPGLSPLELAVLHYQTYMVPFSEQLFNQLGLLLFCAFALIGAFALFSRKLGNKYAFALVIAGLVALVVTFVGTYSDFFGAARFVIPSQVLLAIPVGMAFLYLASLPGRTIVRACLIGTLVFALSFLTVIGPAVNEDNRIFSPNIQVRLAFTQSEVQAFDTISRFYDGEIGIDAYGVRPLQLILAPNNEISSIDDQLFSRDYGDSQDRLMLIRKEIVVNPLQISRFAPFRLDHDPRQVLAEQGFSRIYDSGSWAGFVK